MKNNGGGGGVDGKKEILFHIYCGTRNWRKETRFGLPLSPG